MLAFFQKAMLVGVVSCSGTPTRPIAPPGRAISSAVTTACSTPTHSSTERTGAEAAGQPPDALDRLLAALTDDIRGAELLSQRDAFGVAAEQDDLLGTKPLRCDHAAEADGAVPDDRDRVTWRDPGRYGGVVAGPHHVRQRQQRGHERVVLADRQHDERAVSLRYAHGFTLAAVDVAEAVPAAVQACALQPLLAEDAAAV